MSSKARLLDFAPPVRLPRLPRTIAQWTPLTAECQCQCPHRSRTRPGSAIDASADRPPWPLAVCVSAEEEMQPMEEAAPDQPMHVPREPNVRAGALVVMAAVRGAEPDTIPPGANDRSFLAPVLRPTRRAVGGKCRLARFCSHR